MKPVKTKHKVEENAGYNAGNFVVEKIEMYTCNKKNKGVLKEVKRGIRVGRHKGKAKMKSETIGKFVSV